jgi:hypothetical protein
LPEYLAEKGEEGGRINKEHMQEALTWVDEEIEESFGKGLYHRDGGNFYLDMDKIKNANTIPDTIYNIIDKYLTKVEGIDQMIIKQKILESDDTIDLVQRFKNMMDPEMTPEIFPLVSRGFLYRSIGTSHGSPYDYDTHVPLIFSREDFRKRKKTTRRATVDIAPTIAKYLDIEVPEYCDGQGIDL